MNQASVVKVLKALRMQRSKSFPKIRVGFNGDGGYVICDDLEGIEGVISLGTGPEVSFDLFFAERGVPVYQYDPTVPDSPIKHPNMFFNKIGWGPRDEGNYLGLATILERHKLSASNNLILKFDVEGAEWNSLLGADPALLKKFRLMAGEFHNVHLIGEQSHYTAFNAVFEKLTTHHSVVHVHANNYGRMIMVHGVPVPQVVEFSFLRNDRCEFEPSSEFLPSPLDYPNNPAAPDLVLTPFNGPR